MAVTFDQVQGNTWTTGTTTTVSITPANNADRCLIAIVTMDNAGLTLSSIADDLAQTWTSVGSVVSGDRKVYIYKCVNPAASATVVTFTFSGTKSGNNCGCTVQSFYSVDQTTPTDGFNSGTTSTTLAITTDSGDMTVGAVVTNTTVTVSATSPDTYTKDFEAGVDHEVGHGDTTDGTFTYSFSPTSRVNAGCNINAAAAASTFTKIAGERFALAGRGGLA